MGRGNRAPHILNLSTVWRWVVRYALRPLYPLWGKSLRYPFDRRLGKPQSWSWGGALPEIEPRSSSLWPSHYTDWAVPAPVKKNINIGGGKTTSVKNHEVRGKWERGEAGLYTVTGGELSTSCTGFLYPRRKAHLLPICSYRTSLGTVVKRKTLMSLTGIESSPLILCQ